MTITTKFGIGDTIYCFCQTESNGVQLCFGNVKSMDIRVGENYCPNDTITTKEIVYHVVLVIPNKNPLIRVSTTNLNLPEHLIFGSKEEAIEYVTKNVI